MDKYPGGIGVTGSTTRLSRKRLLVEPRYGVNAPPLWVKRLIVGVEFVFGPVLPAGFTPCYTIAITQ